MKRSKSVVGRVVKSYNDTGKIVSAFRTGRPRKTSLREDRITQRMSLKDRFKSCTEIKRVMNSTSCVNVSRQTVSRRLQEIGLFNRTPRKKPLVSSKNKKKFGHMKIGQKYFSVMKANLIHLEMMEKTM